MKKPVIIVIGIIYILAIVVVGFLGIPARVFNPKTFVSDIQLTFDEKLIELQPSDKADYRYNLETSTAATFNIIAKALPNETSYKECTFQRMDDAAFCTMTTNFTNEYTIATFTCEAIPVDSIKIISVKVRPTDGNKQLFKTVDIIVTNFS